MADKPDFEAIRQQINRRFQRQRLLIFHMLLFVAALVVGAVLTSRGTLDVLREGREWWFVAWGGLLAIHTLVTYMANARDRVIERTWARLYGGEKAVPEKSVVSQRDEYYRFRLSDEGELVRDETEISEKRKPS